MIVLGALAAALAVVALIHLLEARARRQQRRHSRELDRRMSWYIHGPRPAGQYEVWLPSGGLAYAGHLTAEDVERNEALGYTVVPRARSQFPRPTFEDPDHKVVRSARNGADRRHWMDGDS